MTRYRTLAIYFVILSTLCGAVIVGTKALGQRGMYLAQVYMLTPALAAIIVRAFFYTPRFKDANLRLGRMRDYITFWALSLGIIGAWYGLSTALGAVRWDLTGESFLENLAEQIAETGQDINDTLPPGLTPRMMLAIYFVGGLTVFNILPGIITGFGEEFGHRGLMFPLLYQIRPWVGLVGGGLIWYAWHLPLLLVVPQPVEYPLWQSLLNTVILAVGSVFTFIYLAYIYVKSESIFVTSIAHITMNNAAMSFSYLVIIEDRTSMNLGLTLLMMIVVALLYHRKELDIFSRYFASDERDLDSGDLQPQQETPKPDARWI